MSTTATDLICDSWTCSKNAKVTTTLDPDPATASHLIPPDSPNFLDWFESNNVTTLVRLNMDKESGRAS